MAPFNSDPSLVVIAGTGVAWKIPVPFNGIVLGRDQLKLAAPGAMNQAMAAGERPGRRAQTVPQRGYPGRP